MAEVKQGCAMISMVILVSVTAWTLVAPAHGQNLGRSGVTNPFHVCPAPTKPTRIVINKRFDAPRYDFTQSRQQLTDIAARMNMPLLGGRAGQGRRTAAGLTTNTLAYAVRADVLMQPQAGRQCLYLDQITVDLAYENVVIYVAREFQNFRCLRAQIQAHEEEHVRIYRRHFDQLEGEVRRALGIRAQEISPQVVRSQAEARQVFIPRLISELTVLVEQHKERMAPDHQRIDSPMAVRRLYAECE